MRGPEGSQAVPTLAVGGRLDLLVVPDRPPPGDVALYPFVDGWEAPAPLQVTAGADGAFRLQGWLEEPWRLAPGPHTLNLAVGPARAPTPGGPPPEGWATVVVPFEVAPPRP